MNEGISPYQFFFVAELDHTASIYVKSHLVYRVTVVLASAIADVVAASQNYRSLGR